VGPNEDEAFEGKGPEVGILENLVRVIKDKGLKGERTSKNQKVDQKEECKKELVTVLFDFCECREVHG